jgi:hypothetical protein
MMRIKTLSLLVLLLFTINAYAYKPIHLVWLGHNPDRLWEEDWIYEVLSDVKADINPVIDMDYTVFVDQAIIIVSEPDKAKYPRYFAEYVKRNLKFGIIQISDERYGHASGFYPLAQFVIRNYWHKKFAGKKNMLFFPLGYKRKFWDDFNDQLKTLSSRKFIWSFAGQIGKSTRQNMIQNMKKIPNYFIHETSNFNSADALPVNAYRNLLLDSIFVPCPRGWWNLDSFRVSEALECGCIPIVEATPFDYFSKLFQGPYPFLTVTSWEEIPSLILPLLENPDQLEFLRINCYKWWLEYKKTMKQKIASLVENAFELNTETQSHHN